MKYHNSSRGVNKLIQKHPIYHFGCFNSLSQRSCCPVHHLSSKSMNSRSFRYPLVVARPFTDFVGRLGRLLAKTWIFYLSKVNGWKKRTRIRREWWIFHLFCGVCLYGILKEDVLVDQTGGILRFGPVSFSKVLQSAAWASTWESRKHIWMPSKIGDWFGEDMSPVVVHNLCRSSLMTTKKQRSYLQHQTVSIIPDLFIEMALQFCSSRIFDLQ